MAKGYFKDLHVVGLNSIHRETYTPEKPSFPQQTKAYTSDQTAWLGNYLLAFPPSNKLTSI